MLTKTKGLLMNKFQHRSGDIYPQTQQLSQQFGQQITTPTRLPKRQPTHISHINQYNFMSIVNKRPESAVSRTQVKQLQIKNFRLVQEHVRLTEWMHAMMAKVSQGVNRAIQAIQEFKYLEGVNLLHGFLEEMKLYGTREYSLDADSVEPCSSNEYLRGYVNPESKHSLLFDIKKLQLCPLVHKFTFFPLPRQDQPKKEPFSLISPQYDNSPERPKKTSDNSEYRMLMVQSMAVEDLVLKQLQLRQQMINY